jgi:hypothetical protein
MSHLKVLEGNNCFERNGKPFFFLADTLWTAFSNITMEEWKEYLEYRKSQDFNAFQINILTQWDGGKPDTGLYPFQLKSERQFDFSQINEAYFSRAREMLDLAVEMGFTPALVVLWGNYVKDTWMSDNDPTNIIPLELVKPFSEYIAKCFKKYNPVYIISGDTDFRSELATEYYITALKAIREVDPEALITAHLGGGLAEIPAAFDNPGGLDFYMYQSSHNIESQDLAYTLAEKFSAMPAKKPVVNGEPCYEGHAFGGKYGRYNEFHVRRAIWQSLLSGAKAGVTYGAHGVWGWYKEGKEFSNEGYGGRPLIWRKALHLKGAWDASYAKWIFETFELFGLEAKDCIMNETREIRASMSRDLSRIAIYVPYNTDIKTNMDMSRYELFLINLTEKIVARPVLETKDGLSVIKMHDFNSDVLIIGKRKDKV